MSIRDGASKSLGMARQAFAYAWPRIVAAANAVGVFLARSWRGFIVWLGPAADSVRGHLSKDEAKRALTKGLATAATAKVSLWEWAHESGVLEDIGFPILVGLLAFLVDSGRRYAHGAEPGTEKSSTPDETPPTQ